MNIDEKVQYMSKQLIYDILSAVGLPNSDQWYRRFRLFFHKATDQLSNISVVFDQLIVEDSLPQAAQWALNHWCRSIVVRGQENIPPDGPLLVISNHPGAYDALVIAAQLPRPDLHLVASDLPFLRYLHNLSQRICFIPLDKKDTIRRMAGMLSAVHHLKKGGAVLLMGSGTIDPDPSVYPDADKFIHRWTNAINLFLRFTPNTKILLTAVSHIVAGRWARHPLTWIRRGGLEKRRIAEFGQVLQQLLFPGSYYASPRLSFAPTLTGADLGTSPRNALVDREITLLTEHCGEFGGFSSP